MKGKIMIAAAVVIALILAGCFALVQYTRSHIMDGPGMVNTAATMEYFNTFTGGGMAGDSHTLTAELTEDGKVKITARDQDAWDQPEKETTCTTDFEVFLQVGQLLSSKELKKWQDARESKYQVLDAPSTSYSITFNYERYRFGDSQDLPDEAWETMRQVEDILRTALEAERS